MRPIKLSLPPVARPDGAAILALLVLVLLFNPDIAFRGMVLGGYDTFVYFYPLRAYFARAVFEGRLPLWNPESFAGVPFLANPQAAVFYPGTWLFALLDVPSAYLVNLLAHFFLAGLALYAFARWSLGLGPLGSLVGGATFAFSGFLGGQAGHINQVSVAAWLPLVALALDLALRRRGRLPWAVAGVVVGLAMQLLAGHPQEVYMTLVTLGLLVLWRRGGEGLGALARGVGVLTLATGLAFGIAAIQLVPTAELTRLSIRGGGLDYEQAVKESLPWGLLLPSLLPGFWAHLQTTEFFGHLGTIVLTLAWLGVLLGPARPVVLGGLLVVVGLVLALGDGTPVYPFLFDWAPGFGAFRVPARWLFVYTVGASILAAVGTDRVARGAPRVGGAGLRAQGSEQRLARTSDPLATRYLALVPRAVVGLGVPLGLAALAILGESQEQPLPPIWGGLFAATLALALLALRAPRLRGAVVTVLVLGGLAELWLAGADLEHRYPMPGGLAYGAPRESTELIRSSVGSDGRFRVLSIATSEYEVKESPEYRERFDWLAPEALSNLLKAVKWNETLTPNVQLEHRLASPDGYDGGVLPLAAWVKLAGAMLGPDRVRPDGVLASRLDALPERRWLDLLGVRHVLAARIVDQTLDGLYYDRAVTRTLRPGERFELGSLPLGEFTRLGLMSSFSGPSHPGREVGRLELRGDGEAGLVAVPLLDGTHTAPEEGKATGLDPSLRRVDPWDSGGPGGVDHWVADVAFGRRPVTRLAIANTTDDVVLSVRSLNLVDDVRAASFSLTLDERLVRTEFFDMKVYDRVDALPRAYMVTRSDVLEEEAALRRLDEPDFDPRVSVVLAPGEGARTLAGGAAASVAELEVSEPERIRIRARAEARGYVVLSDSWYPGWSATVDGQLAPIQRANILFRAVALEPGEHVVELRYWPRSFRLGAAISVGSCILGLLLWAVTVRHVRRRPG